MRKLSNEELSNLPPGGQGKGSAFFHAIISLKKDEGLFISTAEWNVCRTPSRICRYIEKKFPVKYQCQRNSAESGWTIKRIG